MNDIFNQKSFPADNSLNELFILGPKEYPKGGSVEVNCGGSPNPSCIKGGGDGTCGESSSSMGGGDGTCGSGGDMGGAGEMGG